MAFYTGSAFPTWQGDIFVGALAGQHLRRVRFRGTKVMVQEKLLESPEEHIRDVSNGPGGLIYVLTDGESGRFLKLHPAKK